MKSGAYFLGPSVIKRRSKPRRGRIVDKTYLAWIAAQPCLICGEPATVHHIRSFGSAKDDTRTLPLAPRYHMIQWGPESIESLGKIKFQERHGVDLEAEITRLQQLYINSSAARPMNSE